MEREQVERIAENETLFREVNEQVTHALPDAFDRTADYMQFVCECSRETCTELVTMTREEYESVRADATRFAIIPGHETNGVEHVVGANDRFSVVEKTGRAAEDALQRDPRRAA